jgi:hypothetical protein
MDVSHILKKVDSVINLYILYVTITKLFVVYNVTPQNLEIIIYLEYSLFK